MFYRFWIAICLLITIASSVDAYNGSEAPITPGQLEPITADNITQLELLDVIGTGYFQTQVVWAADQSWVAIGTSAGIFFYDFEHLDHLPYRVPVPTTRLMALFFHAEENVLLAVSADNQFFTYRVEAMNHVTPLHTFDAGERIIYQVYLSEDWSTMVTVDLPTSLNTTPDITWYDVTNLWRSGTPQVINTFQTELRPVIFSADLRIFAFYKLSSGGYHIWVRNFESTIAEITIDNSIHLSPVWVDSNRVLLASLETLWQWNYLQDQDLQQISSLSHYPDNGSSFDASQNAMLLAVQDYSPTTITVWEIGNLVRPLQEIVIDNGRAIQHISFSPQNNFIALTDPIVGIHFYDWQSGEQIALLEPDIFRATPIWFSPDDQYILFSDFAWENQDYSEFLSRVDLSTRRIERLPTPIPSYAAVVYHPTENRIIITDKEAIFLWDLSQPDQITFDQVAEHYDWVGLAAFNPDGSLFVTSNLNTLRIWDSTSFALQREISTTGSAIYFFTFSPDGSLIATITHDNAPILIELWNTETGENMGAYSYSQETLQLIYVTFSPNGNLIVAATFKGEIFVWDIQQFLGEDNPTPSVAITPAQGESRTFGQLFWGPDGNLLAVNGGPPYGIYFWTLEDLMTGQPNPSHHIEKVGLGDFSPDGTLLAAGGEGDVLYLYGIPSGQ